MSAQPGVGQPGVGQPGVGQPGPVRAGPVRARPGEAGGWTWTSAWPAPATLSGLSLDDALFAATSRRRGDPPTGHWNWRSAEGAAPVGVLRAGIMHLQRLQRVSHGHGQLEA